VNRKQRKIFDSIFQTPTSGTIKFSDIEKLLTSLGVKVIEGSGSRVAFEFSGLKLFVHRPHPGKEARKYQVEAVREFLELAGFRDE
jgi:hypothetical protein